MSVLALASKVKGVFRVRHLKDKPVIDNIVFRLHYKFTFAVLLLACTFVTGHYLIGKPINCIANVKVPISVINTFCWTTHTFTIPHMEGKKIDIHIGDGGVLLEQKDQIRYHTYYQWVSLMLFLQAMLVYAPHWIWKHSEGGQIRMITEKVRGAFFESKENRKKILSRTVQYLTDSLHMHNLYARVYFSCEVLNFLIVIANVYFIDAFLGGSFFTYGIDVLKFTLLNQEERYDEMMEVFPRVTKCTFRKFGSSGTIEVYDALCVLATNNLNEKIYIFLWFWFVLLGVISVLNLVCSAAILCLKKMREMILLHQFNFKRSPRVSALIRKIQIGDFLLLHLIGKNLDFIIMRELLDELSCHLHLDPITYPMDEAHHI